MIEAERDRTRGPIATVLVQNGTLNLRDYVVAGSVWGRVRAMKDDKGRSLRKAEPSTPVEIPGLADVPEAGDIFQVVPDEKTAREVAEKRRASQRRLEHADADQQAADAGRDVQPDPGRQGQGSAPDCQGRRARLAGSDPPGARQA